MPPGRIRTEDAIERFGLMAGAAAGTGWVATAFGVVHLFEARPLTHWLINAGYFIVTLTGMGAILAAWS